MEMLVTLAIFTLVMGAIIASVLFFYRSNSYVMEQSYAISEGRKGIEDMVEDIRESVYSEAGDYLVEQIDNNKVVFYSNIDDDEKVERVKYFIDNEKLKKAVAEPDEGMTPVYPSSYDRISVVSDNVRNVENGVNTFTYYNKKGNKMSETEFGNVTDVAFIRVNLVVNVDPYDKPRKFTIRSSTSLRNVD